MQLFVEKLSSRKTNNKYTFFQTFAFKEEQIYLSFGKGGPKACPYYEEVTMSMLFLLCVLGGSVFAGEPR